MKLPRRLLPQRGTSLFSLLIVAIIVGFVFLMGIRVFPFLNEYFTIRRAITQIMKSNPSTVSEVRTAFEKTTEVEYSIHTISSKDLDVVKLGDSDGIRTSFAYNAEIPIVEPVFLLIKFEGSAKSGGNAGP